MLAIYLALWSSKKVGLLYNRCPLLSSLSASVHHSVVVGFEVFTAVALKIYIFRDIKPRSQTFRRNICRVEE
jgi:hypothetical protein